MEYNITTEPAASSFSPSTHQWKYDVFLSFRGADTRFSVVDPLYSSLLSQGIDTFWDEDQLKKGGDIPREIFEAIEKSRISVVIFSEKYASSTWCLDELAKILECRKSQQQILLPIYYDVDPSDVRNQRGTFAEAFVQHEDRFKDDEEEKVLRWRSALTEAATLSGMVLNNRYDESKFINAIIEKILRQLNRTFLAYETDHLVGIDSHLRELNDLLGVGVHDVRRVGIWGIGRAGKTTIAEAVYNSVAHKFKASCFLGNVRENSKAPGGLVQLQKCLLYAILGLKIPRVTNVDSGVNAIKDSLSKKKVLIVLDDVDQLDQLKYLAGSSDWFGAGSRIIISTRDEHLLHAYGVDFTYQVDLESNEALKLFSSNAFPTSRLPDKEDGDEEDGLVKKVESPEMPEADDVDGAKATKTNKGSPGGDENSPDSQKKDQVVDVTSTANVRLSERRIELSNNMDYNITTEPAASSSSPSTHQWKYDVFLSFRGADTRVSFAAHLYDSLVNRRINTFMDDVELRSGESISRALLEAIEDSRISVVVFSENYASSWWRLDELVKILECKKSQQQIVLPIYYDVDPSHVRHQKGTFGEAFHGLAYKYKDDEEKVMRWRMALTEAGNLSAMVFNKDGRESKFIHEITEMILQKLNRVYLTYETSYPVGIDSRIREMNDLLGVGAADVGMVGIWGTGGMGKTTLAKAVYNSIAHKFEGSCFLENVRKNSKAQGGLVQLQNSLLHNILGQTQKTWRVTNVGSGINVIKDSLRKKKVLLVLDDVNQLDQLKYLAGSSDWFGAGSRIVITSRVEHLLLAYGVDFAYQVKELESDEALELFSSNAFPRSRLPDDYQELASSFVGYAQGNPLALTAMGSLLYGKSIEEWHSILQRYERAPASNIHEILKITKKELVHDLQSTRLKEAESPEKLVEDEEDGPNEVGSPEADGVDVIHMGVNATESNKSSTGGDATSADTQKKERLIHQIIDVIESEEPEEPDPADNDTTIEGGPKDFSDWIFLIINLILEIISAICDQFSSSEKPIFAVIGMVLAIVALVICVSELIYKGTKRKFEFGRCRMCLWWFFCPKTERLFGTLPDLFGLICGISQGASSIVQCVCVLRSKDNPFKVNLLPIIFLICVGGSKLFEDCKRCTKYSGPRSLRKKIRAESQDSGERTMSSDRTPVSGSVEGGTVSVSSNLSTQPSFIRKRAGNSNEILGEGAVGSTGDENRFLAAEINGYLLSSQTTSTNLTC